METGFSLRRWDTVGTDPSVCAHCWTSVGASLPLRRLCLSFVSSLDSAGFHVLFLCLLPCVYFKYSAPGGLGLRPLSIRVRPQASEMWGLSSVTCDFPDV